MLYGLLDSPSSLSLPWNKIHELWSCLFLSSAHSALNRVFLDSFKMYLQSLKWFSHELGPESVTNFRVQWKLSNTLIELICFMCKLECQFQCTMYHTTLFFFFLDSAAVNLEQVLRNLTLTFILLKLSFVPFLWHMWKLPYVKIILFGPWKGTASFV